MRGAPWSQLVHSPRPLVFPVKFTHGRTTATPKECAMNDAKDETMGELFNRGLALPREVLGPAYVDNSMNSANQFMMAFQHITTEWCWGYAWTRPGLDRKTR